MPGKFCLASHLCCMCNDYSVWASFTHVRLRLCLPSKMKYNYPHQKIMSLFAGITLTWYVICLPGNSQPQLRVSMGRGMLPLHSREEAVSLPHWLSGMVPQHPPSRPVHLLTSHPLMPLHKKTSNKILVLHHGSHILNIFGGLR